MGTTTPNLSLYKPATTDNVIVGTDLNANYDILDTAVQDLRVPAKGKLWRTSGFTGNLAAGGTIVDFEASRLLGGMTAGAGTDGLVLPKDGMYRITIDGYATDSAAYVSSFTVYRIRSAVADKNLLFLAYWKENGDDFTASFSDEMPLKLGDEIKVKGASSNGLGKTWGTDEVTGVRLHVEYKGPLSGATPI